MFHLELWKKQEMKMTFYSYIDIAYDNIYIFKDWLLHRLDDSNLILLSSNDIKVN